MIAFGRFKFFKFSVAEPSAEFFRLFMHVHNQLRSVDTIRKSGEILDEGSRGQLTARFSSLEDEGSQVGPCGINRSCQSSAACTDNHYCFHGRVTFHEIWLDAKCKQRWQGPAPDLAQASSRRHF